MPFGLYHLGQPSFDFDTPEGAPARTPVGDRCAHLEGSAIYAIGQRILATSFGRAYTHTKMLDEAWIKTLEDGRKVKFIYQELPQDGAFITAQLAGNEVVYSIILTRARNPLSHEDVESRFQGELSKK